MIQNPELDEDSSPEWEAIKNYVGGANKQTKHPLQMEQERIQRRKPQHMDEGGTAGFSDDLLKLSQPQGAGIIAPGLGQPPPQAAPQPPMAPTAPIAPPAVATPPPAAPAQPAPATAPTDAAYEGQATKALGGVTPEMIQALAQKFARPTAGQAVGMGVAGIGDAIASIGGRDPGHMKNAMDMFQKNREMQMKVPEAMATMGKEKYGLTKELGNDDPKSMRSYVQQQANKPLLKDAGFSDAEIKMIPASAIEGLRTGALKADEIRSTYLLQKAIHADTAAYQSEMVKNARAGLANTAANQKAERTQGAAKALAGQGFFKSLTDMIPGTSGYTAHQTLEKEAAGGGGGNFTPDVTAYAEKHGITPEQAQAQKDRRTQGQ
jgi:hypothetical protein